MKNLFENFNGFAEDYLNEMANLNEMAVFRANALEKNIHNFDIALFSTTPYIIYDFEDRKKLISLLFLQDGHDINKIHFVMYFTDVDNNNLDNPFKSLVGKSGTVSTKKLREIWEFEPSYLLYGGYISTKNLPDFDISDKKVLKNLVDLIADKYYKLNGFNKGHLAIDAEDLL